MACASAISLLKPRFTVERRPPARGWRSTHLLPIKSFVHHGQDKVRSPPTGMEESPRHPSPLLQALRVGAVSTQTRPRPSRPPSAHPSRYHSSHPTTPTQCSRQRNLGSWSCPGACHGSLAEAPLRPRKVRPGDPTVHRMRLGEATVIRSQRWRWGWGERFATASKNGPGQWGTAGRALGL